MLLLNSMDSGLWAPSLGPVRESWSSHVSPVGVQFFGNVCPRRNDRDLKAAAALNIGRMRNYHVEKLLRGKENLHSMVVVSSRC